MERRRRPVRILDPYAVQFWEYTLDHELRLQACAECGKLRWPPGPICDACLCEEFEWIHASGTGTLLSWAVFHRQYFDEYPAPHVTGIVELDEGPLFVTNPVGVAVEDLRDGMRMEVDWEAACDDLGDYSLPVFKPLG